MTRKELTEISLLTGKANLYRREILNLVYESKKGHIGGCFSCIDILTMLYVGKLLRYDINQLDWNKRDRFLLSKGHCVLALYVVLCDIGFFGKNELYSFGKDGSYYGCHPDIRVPGIEMTSGSLGNGLGIAVGMAISDFQDNSDRKNVVLTGDGECYEGSIWESAMLAGHYSLKNLIWIIDRNKQCVLDYTEDINRLEPLVERIISFGWDVVEIDGNDIREISRLRALFFDINRKKPLCIVANTVKGKGVSFMERKLEWHHKALSDDLYYRALSELEAK